VIQALATQVPPMVVPQLVQPVMTTLRLFHSTHFLHLKLLRL
jgi:hypothetical protein